jgi:putative DNA primase/helicase
MGIPPLPPIFDFPRPAPAPGNRVPLTFTDSILSAENLDALEIPTRENLVGTWWRVGGQGFIFGPRGLGKTWLAVHLARCLAEGRACGPWPVPKPRRVLYVDGEMPLDGLRERDRALRKATDAPLFFLSHEHHFHRTERGLNLTDREAQAALLAYCTEHKIEVVFLDNLSCLFSGIRENEADAWEAVLPWLLTLRRMGIAICIVHHSGRSGNMRGTTKREDAAFWIMRLDAPSVADDCAGARFIGRFTKNREGDEAEAGPWKWTFQTEAGQTTVQHDRMDNLDMFVQLVADGLDSCKDIADEMGVTKGAVSKWAKRAASMKPPRIKITGGRYQLPD